MLKQVQETFDSLYGELSLPVVLFGSDTRLLNANRAFLDLARIEREDLHQHSLVTFFKDLKAAFERDWMLKVIPDIMQTEMVDTRGNSLSVRMQYTRVAGEDGDEGGLAFIVDARDLKAAERKLEQLTLENRELKEQLSGKEPEAVVHEKVRLEKVLIETRDVVERILESCGDGIFETDRDGRITMVNRSFAEMLGKSKDELVGMFAYELGPLVGEFQSTTGETIVLDQSYCDYQTEILDRMQALHDQDGGKIENWEVYASHKNGTIVPLELTVSLRISAEGIVGGGVTSVRDLTSKKLDDQTVRGARDFLEKVIEASYDGIVVSDMDGMVILTNSAVERLTGHAKKDFVGKRFSEVVKVDSATAELNAGRLTELKEKKRISFETFIHNKKGTLVYLEHGIALIADERNENWGNYIVSVIRDITEKRKSSEALRKAYQFRNEFFTNITHAFRTPLTLSIGPMEGILRGEFGDIGKDIERQLGVSLRNSRQLLKLINQLLDFSRLESDKRNVVYMEKDLEQLVSAVLDSFAFIAKKKKIKLNFRAGNDIPYVSIDPVKMEKALFNLVGNAFKFTPEKGRVDVALERVNAAQDGGRAPQEIAITSGGGCCSGEGAPGCIKIAISDTGAGIKEEELSQIFERFKQGGEGVQQHAGSGIGLAHAREVIELMGGSITVKSTFGQGSTFSIYLPAERISGNNTIGEDTVTGEELVLQPEVEVADIQHDKDKPRDRLTGQKPLILLLDDNVDVLQYIAGILQHDYDYVTALNGSEGLQQLEKHTPDLILCDIMMPEMDGHAFLNRVKESPPLKHIPFIFLTARADTEMVINGLEEGADDYIVKPFNSLELLARIRALLRIRELLSANAVQARKIDTLNQKLQEKFRYGSIIGNSPPMRKIYQMLESIKESDSTVLITGETGTGKELIANSIHYNSPRKDGPLVSVNCGAIPRELMEREFFGHVKGAYTGATESKKGYFMEADGGSLFLDEIGEMDKDMQVKLLRVLERGEVVRVGDTVPTKVDVRLIVATNKDLREEVQQGNFREDLYYRVYVLPIHVPPLRERSDDITLLIEHFMQKMQAKSSIELPPITEAEMATFLQYNYPGNVRELEHIIERFCLFGGKAENLFAAQPARKPETDFPYDELLSSSNPLKAVGQKAKALAEKDVIMHVLQICNNDYNEAARMLNIGLSSLYRKLKEADQ